LESAKAPGFNGGRSAAMPKQPNSRRGLLDHLQVAVERIIGENGHRESDHSSASPLFVDKASNNS